LFSTQISNKYQVNYTLQLDVFVHFFRVHVEWYYLHIPKIIFQKFLLDLNKCSFCETMLFRLLVSHFESWLNYSQEILKNNYRYNNNSKTQTYNYFLIVLQLAQTYKKQKEPN